MALILPDKNRIRERVGRLNLPGQVVEREKPQEPVTALIDTLVLPQYKTREELTRFTERQAVIRQTPETFVQRKIKEVAQALPQPIKDLGDTLREGLFGYEKERAAGLTLDAPFLARLKAEGLLPFLGRPQGEKIAILERSLVRKGMEPKKAGTTAMLDVLLRETPMTDLRGRVALKAKLDELNLTKKEKRTIAIARIGERVGVGLDLLVVAPFGTISRGIKEGLRKSLVKEMSEKGTETILKKAGIADDLAETYAPRFAKTKTTKEVDEGLKSLEETMRITRPIKETPVERVIPPKRTPTIPKELEPKNIEQIKKGIYQKVVNRVGYTDKSDLLRLKGHTEYGDILSDKTIKFIRDYSQWNWNLRPTASIIQELSLFKPIKSITLYRGGEMFGRRGFNSWTYDIDIARKFAKDGKIFISKVHPKDIILDKRYVPDNVGGFVMGGIESEVLVKARVKGQTLTDFFNQAKKAEVRPPTARRLLGIEPAPFVKPRRVRETTALRAKLRAERAAARIGAREGERVGVAMTKAIEGRRMAEKLRQQEIRTLREGMRMRFKALQQGVREGTIKTKEQILEVQSSLIKTIEDIGLPAKEWGKFRRSVKNVRTPEQLERRLPNLLARANRLIEGQEVRVLRRDIGKELKRLTPVKVKGVLKGKLKPEGQERIDIIRKAVNMTP